MSARQLINEAELPLAELNSFPEIEVAFDGADEVDANLNCIKGGGGCHLQEKLVASAAKKFVVVADSRKDSHVLGTKWKKGVPVEVIPLAYRSVQRQLAALGGKPLLRMAIQKAGPVVTDNGNFIIDVDFGAIADPAALHLAMIQIPGVVETGLFCNMASVAYFGGEDGQHLRAGLELNDDTMAMRRIGILDDERVKHVFKSMFDQPDGSLLVLLQGVPPESLGIPASFYVGENKTSSWKVAEFFRDFSELVSNEYSGSDTLVSLTTGGPTSLIRGFSQISLRDEEVSNSLKQTVKEITDSLYKDVKAHAVEKFGEEAAAFDENVKVTRSHLLS
ncbi:hypothetical protein HDU96_005163 [Phlyctochytrium bullatum]|nr:hypothetical protein HDU96_005163 [Phlyctochytrium bullatum]